VAYVGAVDLTRYAAGEEIGWRGYMLTRLIDADVPAPILVSGIVWAAWHMPLILTGQYASGPHPTLSAIFFTIDITAWAVVIAWLRLSSGSVWPCIWAHCVWNEVIEGAFDLSTEGYSMGGRVRNPLRDCDYYLCDCSFQGLATPLPGRFLASRKSPLTVAVLLDVIGVHRLSYNDDDSRSGGVEFPQFVGWPPLHFPSVLTGVLGVAEVKVLSGRGIDSKMSFFVFNRPNCSNATLSAIPFQVGGPCTDSRRKLLSLSSDCFANIMMEGEVCLAVVGALLPAEFCGFRSLYVGVNWKGNFESTNGRSTLVLTFPDAVARARNNLPQFLSARTDLGLPHEDKVQARAALLPR